MATRKCAVSIGLSPVSQYWYLRSSQICCAECCDEQKEEPTGTDRLPRCAVLASDQKSSNFILLSLYEPNRSVLSYPEGGKN